MAQYWIDLVSVTAWPVVGLIALLMLLPGGQLKGILNELGKVTTSVDELKNQVEQLKDAELRIRDASGQVSQLSDHLTRIGEQVENIKQLTADLVAESFTAAQFVKNSKKEPHVPLKAESRSPVQLYNEIENSWSEICNLIRDRLGDNSFDARSVGYAARRLADNRRKNPITRETAEKIDTIFSTMKRFRRLRGTLEAWMNDEVYANVSQDIEAIKKELS